MEKTYSKIMMLSVAFMISMATFAETKINGVYYNLIGKSRTAEVTSSPNKYSGSITIPETVEYEGLTYSVTQIGEKAFSACFS